MPKFKDYTGHRFGRLTVIKLNEELSGKGKGSVWDCKCDCGNEKTVPLTALLTGNTSSCGCLFKDVMKERNTTHGLAKTSPVYNNWGAMKQRCYYQKHRDYAIYGGRGITVCDEWRNDFKAFHDWAMTNGYKDGYSLDRRDPNGNYCPENCRWVPWKTQANNTRRNRYIEYDGEVLTLSQAAEKYNIPYHTLKARIGRLNWPIDLALHTPVTLANNNVVNTRKVVSQ